MILFASSLSRTSYGTKALPKPVPARVAFGDATRGDVNAVIGTAVESFKGKDIVLTPSKVSPENAALNVEENDIVANGTSSDGQFFSLYHTADRGSLPKKSIPSGILRIPVNVNNDTFGVETITAAFRDAGFLG